MLLEYTHALGLTVASQNTKPLGSIANAFGQTVNKSAADHELVAEHILFEGIPRRRMSIQNLLHVLNSPAAHQQYCLGDWCMTCFTVLVIHAICSGVSAWWQGKCSRRSR
jgi:hypothetical protein